LRPFHVPSVCQAMPPISGGFSLLPAAPWHMIGTWNQPGDGESKRDVRDMRGGRLC